MDGENLYIQDYFATFSQIGKCENDVAEKLKVLRDILPPEQYNEIATFDITRSKLIHTISENDLDDRYFDEQKVIHDMDKYEKLVDSLPIPGVYRYKLYDLVLYANDKFELGNTHFYNTVGKQLTDMPEGKEYDDEILRTLKYAYMHRGYVDKSKQHDIYYMAYEKLTRKKLFPDDLKKEIRLMINQAKLDKRNEENKRKLDEYGTYLKNNPQLSSEDKIKTYQAAFEIATKAGYSRNVGFMMKSNICGHLGNLYAQRLESETADYYRMQSAFWRKMSNKAIEMAKIRQIKQKNNKEK